MQEMIVRLFKKHFLHANTSKRRYVFAVAAGETMKNK